MAKPPESVRNTAARGLREWQKWKDSGAETPATRVGLIRANQLAKGENISLKTINRMKSFLERHAKNYDPGKRDTKGRLSKGTVSYLLWGGQSALTWVNRVLKQNED